MLELLKYREDSSYFNDWDYFLLYDLGIKKMMITEVHLYNGHWYSTEGLQYRMNTVLCINCSELYGREVELTEHPVRGKITHFVRLNIGVNWYRGKQIKENGLPYFWYEPKNLKLIK